MTVLLMHPKQAARVFAEKSYADDLGHIVCALGIPSNTNVYTIKDLPTEDALGRPTLAWRAEEQGDIFLLGQPILIPTLDIDTSTLPKGWFNSPDIIVYRWIYRELVPLYGKTVEVGVYRGRSLISIADIIREKKINVFAIDDFEPFLDDPEPRETAFNETLIKHDLTDFVYPLKASSTEAAANFTDNSLDFVFIDADHKYESVTADIKAWEPKVKNGGWIGGHDYQPSWPDVIKAVDDYYQNISVDCCLWRKQINRNATS